MPLSVGIIGSGNIGTDLVYKILENPSLQLDLVAGIDLESEGLRLARGLGVRTSSNGLAGIIANDDIEIVIDATSAAAHRVHAPRLLEAGKFAIDLTPAAVGPRVVPAVNLDSNWEGRNVNLISCAAQATIPIVAAISRATKVSYAEIASGVSSRSAGPGTRQNIDEFTHTTSLALREVGGAESSKTIIAINPADPPMMMRNTIYAQVGEGADVDAIVTSIESMVKDVQAYVPGYRVTMDPFYDGDYIITGLEVEGAGHYLPPYAGNLDIITAAATAVAERYAALAVAHAG